jgi:hypothetical protein
MDRSLSLSKISGLFQAYSDDPPSYNRTIKELLINNYIIFLLPPNDSNEVFVRILK